MTSRMESTCCFMVVISQCKLTEEYPGVSSMMEPETGSESPNLSTWEEYLSMWVTLLWACGIWETPPVSGAVCSASTSIPNSWIFNRMDTVREEWCQAVIRDMLVTPALMTPELASSERDLTGDRERRERDASLVCVVSTSAGRRVPGAVRTQAEMITNVSAREVLQVLSSEVVIIFLDLNISRSILWEISHVPEEKIKKIYWGERM